MNESDITQLNLKMDLKPSYELVAQCFGAYLYVRFWSPISFEFDILEKNN